MQKLDTAGQKPFAALAELLKQLRVRLGMTQADLAALSGVDHSYLSRLEKGDRRPSPRMLMKLAAALQVSYETLATKSGLLEMPENPKPTGATHTSMSNALQVDPGRARRAIPVYTTVPAGLFKDANTVDADDEVPYLVLAEEELGYDPRAFALVVSGDSMVEAGILDGDVLVVSPGTRVQNGDIAVVCIEGGANTVKKVYFDKGTVLLQPCNSHFRPEVYDESEVDVLGKVILVRRKL